MGRRRFVRTASQALLTPVSTIRLEYGVGTLDVSRCGHQCRPEVAPGLPRSSRRARGFARLGVHAGGRAGAATMDPLPGRRWSGVDVGRHPQGAHPDGQRGFGKVGQSVVDEPCTTASGRSSKRRTGRNPTATSLANTSVPTMTPARRQLAGQQVAAL